MIEIVKAPLQLEPFSNKFKDLFTKSSRGSFRDICGALSVCDKSETVANICDTVVECREGKKARSSHNCYLAMQIRTKMKLHSAKELFLLVVYV